MAGESQITVVGNLTDDPRLTFTNSGHAVANMSIAVNAKKFDRQRNEWVDQTPTFWRASIWRDYAEHVASTLRKGMQVIAVGTIASHTYEKEGQQRSAMEIELSDIGPALRFQEAQVRKTQRSEGQQQGQGGSGYGGGFGGQQQAQQQPADPWAAPSGQTTQQHPSNGGWGNPGEAPF